MKQVTGNDVTTNYVTENDLNNVTETDLNHVTGNENYGSDSDDDSVTEVDPTVFETVDTPIPKPSDKSPKPQSAQKSQKIKKEMKRTKPDGTSITTVDQLTRKKVKSNPKSTQSVEAIVTTETEVEPCHQVAVKPCQQVAVKPCHQEVQHCQQVKVKPCQQVAVKPCQQVKVGVKRSRTKTNSSPTKRKKK